MSFDDPEKNAAWKADKGFSFELWTDSNRELAAYYDAGAEKKNATRVTKVLDAEGTLVLEYVEVNVSTHPAAVLEDVQAIFGKR